MGKKSQFMDKNQFFIHNFPPRQVPAKQIKVTGLSYLLQQPQTVMANEGGKTPSMVAAGVIRIARQGKSSQKEGPGGASTQKIRSHSNLSEAIRSYPSLKLFFGCRNADFGPLDGEQPQITI